MIKTLYFSKKKNISFFLCPSGLLKLFYIERNFFFFFGAKTFLRTGAMEKGSAQTQAGI
jgi:hypothetical protein